MTNGMISISSLSTFLTNVAIFHLHLHMVSITDSVCKGLFDIRLVLIRGSLLNKQFDIRYFYSQLSANYMVVTMILFVHTNLLCDMIHANR
jgi:hypothetical protein